MVADSPSADYSSDWEAFFRDYRKPGYVPGFEITTKLGEGVFGVVFKARKQSIEKDYAIKFLRVSDAEVRSAVLRELDQVKLFAQVDHPNLVSIEDRGEVDRIPYLVMQFAGTETLRSRMPTDERRPNPEEAKDLLTWYHQVCRGVGALHERSLVHFDIKPANIFLRGGVARVGDYGLSKLMTQSCGSLSMRRGTPYYMAPEMMQFHGDHRSDIYSLGVVLFEMLCGRVPFDGTDEWKVLKKHEKEQPVVPPGLSAAHQAVILRCLEKEPAARFQSVGDLVAALGDTGQVFLTLASKSAVAPQGQDKALADLCRKAVALREEVAGDRDGRKAPYSKEWAPVAPENRPKWERAAAMGIADGMYLLGINLMKSAPDQAVDWLSRAAAAGHRLARTELGKHYLEAGNVEQAMPHLHEAAMAGCADACYRLADCYGAKSPMRSREHYWRWVAKAADMGHGMACIDLKALKGGAMDAWLLAGPGTPSDSEDRDQGDASPKRSRRGESLPSEERAEQTEEDKKRPAATGEVLRLIRQYEDTIAAISRETAHEIGKGFALLFGLKKSKLTPLMSEANEIRKALCEKSGDDMAEYDGPYWEMIIAKKTPDPEELVEILRREKCRLEGFFERGHDVDDRPPVAKKDRFACPGCGERATAGSASMCPLCEQFVHHDCAVKGFVNWSCPVCLSGLIGQS